MKLATPTLNDVTALAELHFACWCQTYRGICADDWLDSLTLQDFEEYHRPRLLPTIDKPIAPDPTEPFVVARCETTAQLLGFVRGGPTRKNSHTGDTLAVDLARDCSAELYALYVDQSQQRRGVGRALFDAVVAALRAQNHRSMCLWVLSDNVKARRFYESRGGRADAHAPITLGNARYDQVAYVWDVI